jgi:quercetin dioxygenase-like cupin family protein
MSRNPSDLIAVWPPELRAELEANRYRGCVGQVLLSESERVRVWSLRLKPGERVGFHRHVLDYFWTVLTDGHGRSHYEDGRTADRLYNAGDTQHLRYGKGEYLLHDLENIGENELIFTTVEFLDSANSPLPVPNSARRVS